jgi:hypothetical protein
MFMHIAGTGDEATLASSVGRVFARMTETAGGRGEVLNAAIDPSQTSLDTKKIEDVLAKGLRAALDQTRHAAIQAK